MIFYTFIEDPIGFKLFLSELFIFLSNQQYSGLALSISINLQAISILHLKSLLFEKFNFVSHNIKKMKDVPYA